MGKLLNKGELGFFIKQNCTVPEIQITTKDRKWMDKIINIIIENIPKDIKQPIMIGLDKTTYDNFRKE